MGAGGAAGAWGLLPQALIAVALTILATQGRMRLAAGAYALALVSLLALAGWAGGDGVRLMTLLNMLLAGVAAAVLLALGRPLGTWLPLRLMAATAATLVGIAGLQAVGGLHWTAATSWPALVFAAAGALLVVATGWLAGPDLRQALRR